MSTIRLQEARNRLDLAIARLERAVRDRDSAQMRDRDSARMNGDAALSEELQTVRARCEALERRSQEVSNRLAVTIDRVKGLLED